MKAALLSIFLIFGCSGTLWGAEKEISVKAEVNKAFLTIGEKVEYLVTLTHNPSLEIISKIVPPPSNIFEIKEAHDFFEKQGKEIVEGRKFIITLYDLGEFILDPVTVKYKNAKGEEKTIETNRLYLTVRSVDAGKPKTDIRGTKGVLSLPHEWLWFWATLLLLLASGGGGFLWWRWKHRLLKGAEAEENVLSPEDEALIRLNRLIDSDLIRRGKLKEYFLELSNILRHYFERRFQILAVESTTSEILQNLKEKEVPQNLREKIREVLEAADLVKFAKWNPAPAEIIRINQTSKTIIEEAKPPAPAPQPVGDPSPHVI